MGKNFKSISRSRSFRHGLEHYGDNFVEKCAADFLANQSLAGAEEALFLVSETTRRLSNSEQSC
jgi:hypothetical protein